jgi:hypothetical protein
LAAGVYTLTQYCKMKTMHVSCKTEVRSWNHFCSGQAINIGQPVCAFVALGIQNVIRMLHIIIYDKK